MILTNILGTMAISGMVLGGSVQNVKACDMADYLDKVISCNKYNCQTSISLDSCDLSKYGNLQQLIEKYLGGSCTGGNGSGTGDTCTDGSCDTADKEDTGTDNITDESTEIAYIKEVFKLVNEERKAQGLSELVLDETLCKAASVRAKESATSFSHTRPDGTPFSTVLKEYNVSYRRSGENIAYGQKSPAEVMKAWMNSSGHRANILGSSFTNIGIGCYIAPNGTIYWSQLFTA